VIAWSEQPQAADTEEGPEFELCAREDQQRDRQAGMPACA